VVGVVYCFHFEVVLGMSGNCHIFYLLKSLTATTDLLPAPLKPRPQMLYKLEYYYNIIIIGKPHITFEPHWH